MHRLGALALACAVAGCQGEKRPATESGFSDEEIIARDRAMQVAHAEADQLMVAIPTSMMPLVRARVDARARAPTKRDHELDPLIRYLLARMCLTGTDVGGDDLLDRMFPPPVMAIAFSIGCGFAKVEPFVTIDTFVPPVMPGLARPTPPAAPPALSLPSRAAIENTTRDLLRLSYGHMPEEVTTLATWMCGPGREPIDLDRMFPPALVPHIWRVTCGAVVLAGGRPVVTYIPPLTR